MQDAVSGVGKAQEVHDKRRPQDREEELLFCCRCCSLFAFVKIFSKECLHEYCSVGKFPKLTLESNQ